MQIDIDPDQVSQVFFFIKYFDPIQKKDVYLPTSNENLKTDKLVIEKKHTVTPTIYKITVNSDCW